MPVAKTYTNWRREAEPFIDNGKSYIMVYHPSTQKPKRVRWYTDVEYAKMYNLPTVEVTSVPAGANPEQKRVLGFSKGYITIFKGDTYANLEWFQKSIARYCKWWGWYIVSTEAVPFDLPAGLEPIELKWELVGEEEGMLKSDAEVKAAVDSILYDKGNSTFQGMVGARLDLELEVISAHKKDGYYGEQTIHYMVDSVGNQYLWATTSKSWEVGDKRHIKGTVKDHKVIRNVETTVLTRCTLVK